MMSSIKPVYTEHQLKRWMRPDAHRFIHPDWRRFVQPGSELAAIYEHYERKYRPDQLHDDHGRWAYEGGDGGPGTTSENDEAEDGDRLPANAKPT